MYAQLILVNFADDRHVSLIVGEIVSVALCDGLADARSARWVSVRCATRSFISRRRGYLVRAVGRIPWRPLPTDAGGLSIREIGQRLERIAMDRQALIDRERPDSWRRICQYKDSKGNPHNNRLDGLLLHVANHGIHHRAQALNFLKGFGRTVRGGLDFIFFRLAKPFIALDPSTLESMRQYGIEVATGSSPPVAWDAALIRNYFAYGDWCNGRLLDLAAPLDAAALDRDFVMGMGTIRKTALHIADAELVAQELDGPQPVDKAHISTGIDELRTQWKQIAAERNRFLESLDDTSVQRVVTALIGPMSIRMPVIESVVQLCGHGTHHRAQQVNMLRQCGVTAPGIDYIIWLRELAAC